GAGAGAVPDPGERVDDRDGRAAVFDAHSGERRWFEISSRAGGEGEDLRFAVDAAPAVHAEGALRRFVETLTETFAHIRIGLAIFDRERRLGLFNPAFAELMRLDPAWLAARPDLPAVLAQLRESRRLPDHEDFGQWRRGILGLFGEGEGDALRGPRPERTEIWHLPGEEQIRMVARPHPQGAVAFLFEDVTETARLERRFLTETETRRAVMDRLEEGVVAFGPDGVARFANPAFAAMWGFRPGADGDGLRLADALARFRARSAGREVWDRLAGFFAAAGARSAWSDEVALTDGRRLRARVAALPDGSVLVAFLDVTDALRAEAAMRDRSAALEAAEEIRSALIEQVSLRMRTPLARVSGLTQRLRDGASDGDADAGGWGTGGGASRGGVSGGGMSGGGASRPAGFGEDGVISGGGAVDGVLGPRQLALLDGVLEAAAQMQEALTGVADLASAQAGVLAMSPEPVNLRAALASALDVARRRAQARGVALSLEADEALDASQAVTGDAQRLRQLLFNLVADAVHRAPAGGWVRAGARRLGERVEVWTDEPAPEAVAEGRTEAEAAVRGGLAHALVRRFAELHDGGVRVELVRRGAPAMSPDALDGEEVGPRGDRLHVICSLPLTALRPTTATEAEALRAESA
ncbi:MAG: PAS-domain containing protein, partial [Pseudomonadota bacterium]|nr:PAS-domain containing protein [Pseudomonadota bacterium]